MPENVAYGFDSQHQTSVSEKDEEDGNEKVDNEHVDDIWFVIEAWSQGVVVRSAGALHALWEVPAWESGNSDL